MALNPLNSSTLEQLALKGLTASICQDVTASRGTVARDISSRALMCDDAKLYCISADQSSDFTPSTLHPQATPGVSQCEFGGRSSVQAM